MLKSEKHLRWLGLDMRPRWCRRTAVMLTYVAFIAAIGTVESGGLWGHPGLTSIVLTMAVFALGVFSDWGPVKSFASPSPGKYVAVHGLDDLARYRYGVANYEAANEQQKSDLLQTYHVGRRLYPRKPGLDEHFGLDEKHRLNEREEKERVDAERWAHRWLMTMIAIVTGRYLRHTAPTSLEVVGDLLWLFILGQTLPAARVLWTELDPRGIPREAELVRKEA